jgi:acetyltransferase
MNDRTRTLDPFFRPRSVAVVGASSRETSAGHAVLKNLLFGRMDGTERAEGFAGPVFAVNAKGGEVLGQKCSPSLSSIKEPVDLVVIAIPPPAIIPLLDECAAHGVKNAIVISAGFAEMGEPGKALEKKMADAARGHGIRIIGPNCLGVIRPSVRLNASFAFRAPRPGGIGLFSQSGALITGIISYAEREQFGLSAIVSLGSKADVEDEDVLRWLADDPETTAIAVYLEQLKEPRQFVELARELSAKKPLIAIKGGTTAAGAKAASSHTGSLAGSEAAYAAAFAQAGILQARTISDFIAWARAIGNQPVARGKRLAVITNAGGPGVLAADAADRHGIEIATLSEETLGALNEVLPAVWSHGNPIDVIGDATPERYRDTLRIVGRAPEVDGILLIMTEQAMTAPLRTAQAIEAAVKDPGWTKPIVCSFLGLIGTDVGSYLDARGIPEFNMPELAVSAMSALMRRGETLYRPETPAPAAVPHPAPDREKARRLVLDAQKAGQTNLDLARARDVLAAAGLRYNESGTAKDDEEAARIAEKIGYPVVLKVVSPDVLHKSDVGGVELDVVGADGVREACARIRGRIAKLQPGARIDGFTVEEQVKGTEIIVGMSRDPDFGALLMVGMGGIFVEVYKDVAFRMVPLRRRDALDMIGEIKAQALFDGARKRPKLDRDELAEILLRISALVEAAPEIKEIDLNPLVITEKGLVAIDARVIAG